MNYSDKYNKIKKFVKLKVNKELTRGDKYNISKYFNYLNSQGFLDSEKEGYVLKNITRTKVKIKNNPKLKYQMVNVGTSVVNGEIVTAPDAKIYIKNGIIKVKRGKLPYKWQFNYNINKDWKIKDFIKHIQKNMLPEKIKKGQIFIIGAGVYEMKGTSKKDIEKLCEQILGLSYRYTSLIEKGERKESKAPKYFMNTIYVYDNIEAFRLRQKDMKKKKRISKKRKNKRNKK